ncbi:ATP-binding cassette domain-containing protein [Nocardia zapadnayensis]|uniref:ATP-binding cassette domain-containing protein n=1 Tax=Nocardia rhamnosiphila TaxID=426716 RepID=UPI00224513CB|nr:ATP-binding cassette domain-containing protein [Nocardia zapadnayensis]MCX0274841.1 ATP-binding cassette domain-containing protein [Nocardia zapadnayensis]
MADTIDFALRAGAVDARRRRARIPELLDLAPEVGRRRPNELSGGMRQRVSIARMLAGEPAVMLMDEPFAALTRLKMQDLVSDLWTRLHRTLVFVTHDIDEAIRLADTVGVLRDGRIVEQLTNPLTRPRPADTLAEHADTAKSAGHCTTNGASTTMPRRSVIERESRIIVKIRLGRLPAATLTAVALSLSVVACGDSGGGYSQHSLYLATQAAIAATSPAITAFFAALDDAGAELEKISDTAVAAVATATQLDPGLLRDVLSQFDFTLQLDPDLAPKLTELGTWAGTQGSIAAGTRLPDYAGLLEDRFLPRKQ